jgi:hypothetical protein
MNDDHSSIIHSFILIHSFIRYILARLIIIVVSAFRTAVISLTTTKGPVRVLRYKARGYHRTTLNEHRDLRILEIIDQVDLWKDLSTGCKNCVS